MTTRRNVLRSIPAAIALAIMPSRLTRNVEAAEPRADGITVCGAPLDGWLPNIERDPAFIGYGSPAVELDPMFRAGDLIEVTITGSHKSWSVNRWSDGTLTFGNCA